MFRAWAALGEAAAEIYENFDAKIGHMYEIKQRFIDEVTQIPGVTVNGKTGRDSGAADCECHDRGCAQ